MDLTDIYNPQMMKTLTDERAIVGHLKQRGVSDPDEIYLHKTTMTDAAKSYRKYGWLCLILSPIFLLMLVFPGLVMLALSFHFFSRSGKQLRAIEGAFGTYEKELQAA